MAGATKAPERPHGERPNEEGTQPESAKKKGAKRVSGERAGRGRGSLRPSPSPVDPEAMEKARDRADRTTGVMMLIVGAFATISNMLALTENSLAASFAQMYAQLEIGAYHRPPGLETLSTVGIFGHPIIYGITLYIALRRWKAKKRTMWLIVLGAVVAFLFSLGVIGAGISLHPELTVEQLQRLG